ncbi:DNA alkylation repair protein [bacterium]|nr:DNA alkylation repair protein [bacterium]
MHPMAVYLRRELRRAADPKKSGPMQAYMKNVQPFYGIQMPARKKIFQSARKKFTLTSYDEYETVIQELWRGKFREELYLAVDIAIYYKAFRSDPAMRLYEWMLTSADNWDTVDPVASHLVGDLVLQNRKHESNLKKWTRSKNKWLRRTALLAHLRHKNKTNRRLLEETILSMTDEREFFIQKAIGWILRQYAYTDPKWVIQFVRKHSGRLSNLAKREALKHQNKRKTS